MLHFLNAQCSGSAAKRVFGVLSLVLFLASCAKSSRPEITWSLMHPTTLDTVYMAKVIAESASHPVDNFEICGGCNAKTNGSLDGLLYFEEYPLAKASQDSAFVAHNRASMKRILEMAHAVGKPVYYWHREVLCNDGMVASWPGLLDEDGEFNLLGEEYEKYLRYKLRKTFEFIPELDGIVLTLTEASYSTIHNSRPDIYPADTVVEKISRVFAEELTSRGKRFILRSFGSIDADYDAIQKGARLLAKDYSFEIETKITPFDFSPFLPDNPYLYKIPGCTLGAECDGLGEYYGAGRMCSEDIESIVRYVKHAKNCKVDRFTIRMDRHGKNIFDVSPINIYAYEQAITNPGLIAMTPSKAAEKIRMSFYGSSYPDSVARELSIISKEGIEGVHRTPFASGNVVFHQTPTLPVMKFLKSGGFLASFASEGKFKMKKEQWGMVRDSSVVGRDSLLREKAYAVALAEDALSRLNGIKDQISEFDYNRLKAGLEFNWVEAYSLEEFFKVIAAYFDGIESGDKDGALVSAAFAELQRNLADFSGRTGLVPWRPVEAMAKLFVEEYPLEFAAREALSGANDFVLPGGTFDQIRVEQYMHGAYPEVIDKVLGIRVGNGVFPNGYIKMYLKECDKLCELRVAGIGDCEVLVNGKPFEISMTKGQPGVIDLPVSTVEYEVVCRKASGKAYPFISSVSVFEK